MNRRAFLGASGVIFSVPVVGCLSNTDEISSENGDKTNDSTEEAWEISTPTRDESSCSFHVKLVEEPPEDASIVYVEEEKLEDVAVINHVFEKAANPDVYEGTVKMRSGEYEQINVSPDSTEEYEEAVEALDSLPSYNNPDYPSGIYLTTKTDKIIAVIAEVCLF